MKEKEYTIPSDPRAQLKSRKIYIFSLIEAGRLKMAQEEMKHYLEIKIKIAEEDLRNFIDETQDKL